MEQRTIPRSQFIYPYGPGAILDWGQECFVVLDTRLSSNPSWKFGRVIRLARLEGALGVQNFRMPPVASRFGHQKVPVAVHRFPAWLFCPRCRTLYHWTWKKEKDSKGRPPRCPSKTCQKPSTVELVPMRYVAACVKGHLEDVNWHWWAHSGPKGTRECETSYKYPNLEFRADSGRGATLDALSVRCRTCGSKRTLKDLLRPGSVGGHRMGMGKQPWQPMNEAEDCDERLHVLQRSQTAVHYSETRSAIDIRQLVTIEVTERERALEATLKPLLKVLSELEDQICMSALLAKKANARLDDDGSEDLRWKAKEVEDWLRASGSADSTPVPLQVVASSEEQRLRLEEWPALCSTSEYRGSDAPLIVAEEPMGDKLLERFVDGVFLVEKLREVRAFYGFSRVRGEHRVFPHLGERPPQWLPAVEVFGEGIFVRFDEHSLSAWEEAHRDTLTDRLGALKVKIEDGEDFVLRKFTDWVDLLPRFLVVHTFSHILMRQLCYECGYSGASLRERLFVFSDRAGVLIYTADGDSEGSLGGLVRQGRKERFSDTVLTALERSSWCSNDPICSEMPAHGPGRSNHAACHACVLVSETSCPHSNALLDRSVVVGGGERSVGFFRPMLEQQET